MKIYFACSITGGREFEPVYQSLVQALAENGHNVLTAHLAEPAAIKSEAVLSSSEVYMRDVEWIRDSDVLIAEVSVPSHGVGYEIGFALTIGKPVLALSEEGRKVSKMISGNPNPNLTVKTYKSIEDAIKTSLAFLSKND
jgi:nucleoside 2-deoxyribosyltransferase